MKTYITICLVLSAVTLIFVIVTLVVVLSIKSELATKKEWEAAIRRVRDSDDDGRELRERLLETYHNPAEAEMAYVYIKEGKVVSVKPVSVQGDGKHE
jgi:hypothetical protein